MPSFARAFIPDFATIASFFGAVKNSMGGHNHVPKSISQNWVNRVAPYTLINVAGQILEIYLLNPRTFGANAGVGHFEPLYLPIFTARLRTTWRACCIISSLKIIQVCVVVFFVVERI